MKTLSLLILLCLSTLIYSQEASIKTDKESYSYNDLIKVTAEINTKCDSFNLPNEYPGFRRVSKITKTSTLATSEDGTESFFVRHDFKLVAEQKGKLEIRGPVYFIDGKKYQAKPISIEILKEE
jgi:hypothetical protein